MANASKLLVSRNRWRTIRYGFDEGMLDLARGEIRPYAALLEEILDLVREDAQAMGCLAEVERQVAILRRGSTPTSRCACIMRPGTGALNGRRPCVAWSTG